MADLPRLPWRPPVIAAIPPARRELALVVLNATLVGMTIALTMPLLTVNLERAGADSFTIGLSSAAGGVGIFLVGPFIGRLVERLGAAACFRLGIAVCAGCLLLFAAHTGVWYWFWVRLLYGCAGAVVFVLNEATVNSLVGDADRGRVIGLYGALFTVGYAGGPLLLLVAGTEGRLPFIAAAALFLVALAPTFFLGAAEEGLRPHGGGEGRRLGLADVWRAAPLPLGAVFVYAIAEGVAFALMPVWALGIGLGGTAAAALVGVWLSGNIALQLPLGWLADRVPRARVLAGCAAGSGLGLLAVPLLTGGGASSWPLWALLALVGGLSGSVYTVALMLLGDRFRGPDLTAANTAFVMTFQLGIIAGPPLAGAAMEALGPAVFPLTLVPPLAALAVLALRRAPP